MVDVDLSVHDICAHVQYVFVGQFRKKEILKRFLFQNMWNNVFIIRTAKWTT